MEKFTVIVSVTDATGIPDLVSSLKKQEEIDFEKDIQLILVAGSKEACRKMEETEAAKCANVTCLTGNGNSLCQSACCALDRIRGKYVALIHEDCSYSPYAFSAVLSAFDEEEAKGKIGAVSLSPVFLIPDGENTQQPYANQPGEGKEGLLDVTIKPDHLQLMLEGYFYEVTLFKSLSFANYAQQAESSIDCMDEGRYMVVLEAAAKSPVYAYIRQELYYRQAQEDFLYLFAKKRCREWYSYTLRHVYIPFAQRMQKQYGKVPQFVGAVLVYLLYNRFEMNKQERDQELLHGKDLDAFLDDCCELLSYVDYDCILRKVSFGDVLFYDFMRLYFMQRIRKEYGRDYEMYRCGSSFFYTDDEEEGRDADAVHSLKLLADYSQKWVTIYAMNVEKRFLVINGSIADILLLEGEDLTVYARINGKTKNAKKTEIYSQKKYFGRVFSQDLTFQLQFPFEEEDEVNISFFVRAGQTVIRPVIRTARSGSRLSTMVEDAYWNLKDDRVMRIRNNRLEIRRADEEKMKLLEACVQDSAFLARFPQEQAEKMVALRKRYFACRDRYKKKNVWVTFDRLYKGGDNGEYVFRYISEHCSDIDMYYIIRDDCPDYARLKKKYKNVLPYHSEEARLVSLLADAILTPHMTVMDYCGFDKEEAPYFLDLFHARIICIQHGLTVQNIAQWQNRLFDNIALYGCASKYEVENLKQPIYGYADRQLVLTGLARFDGLKSVRTKQILISPTWRRNLVNTRLGHNENLYNPQFKESEYFRRYQALISDERLLAKARERGYTILFLLHPVMSGQLRDFEGNDVVTVRAASDDISYETVLTHSDVMVTDYSGIQFDFAYMRKPILYYHPATMPSHYTESAYFCYDKMGFGPICTEHDALVDALCGLIENDCKNDPVYLDRANDFFAFDDFQNCRRIYEATKEYLFKYGHYTERVQDKVRRKLCEKK